MASSGKRSSISDNQRWRHGWYRGGGGGGLQYRVMIEGAMEDAGLTKSQVEVLHHVDEHFFHIRTLKLHILGYN